MRCAFGLERGESRRRRKTHAVFVACDGGSGRNHGFLVKPNSQLGARVIHLKPVKVADQPARSDAGQQTRGDDRVRPDATRGQNSPSRQPIWSPLSGTPSWPSAVPEPAQRSASGSTAHDEVGVLGVPADRHVEGAGPRRKGTVGKSVGLASGGHDDTCVKPAFSSTMGGTHAVHGVRRCGLARRRHWRGQDGLSAIVFVARVHARPGRRSWAPGRRAGLRWPRRFPGIEGRGRS